MMIKLFTIINTSISSLRQHALLIFVFIASFFCHITWATESSVTINNGPDKVHVLLVNPSIENDSFWQKIEKITEQAAVELDIKLTIIHGYGTRFFQLEELKKYFN